MKKACSFILTIMLFFGCALCLPKFDVAVALAPELDFAKIIDGIIDAKKQEYNTNDILKSQKFLNSVGNTSSDWLAFSLARYGYSGDYSYYLGAVSQFVEKKYETPNKISKDKPTEWHRLSLAVGASGASQIIGVSGNNKINLYNDGIFYKDAKQFNRQGLPAYIWALITINALNLPAPNDAVITKQNIIDQIILSQKNGGFMLTGDVPDADMTAMAITALINEQSQNAKTSVEAAIETLSEIQNSDGTFNGMNKANAASTAWALVALSSANIDFNDARFVKNGNTIVSALQKFALPNGGYSQNIGEEYDSMTTTQVLYAYTALLRAKNGEPALFDLTNSDNNLITQTVLTQQDKQAALTYKDKKATKENYFDITRLKYLINMSPEYDGRAEQLTILNNALIGEASILPIKQLDVKLLVIIIVLAIALCVGITILTIFLVKKRKAKK